jgi:hypothetical protein
VSLYLGRPSACGGAKFLRPACVGGPSNIQPQIYRIAKSLDAIRVPPPIPSAVPHQLNTVAQQTGAGRAADYGMLALDLFARIGGKHSFSGVRDRL